MGMKSLVTIIVMHILLTSCNYIRGGKSTIFKVQTIDGDTYNCVDFYKQPGFDHPLLKNHSYHPQMKLYNYLEKIKDEKFYQPIQLSNIWHNGKGCPDGTVPIPIEFYRARMNYLKNDEPGYHFAGIRTRGHAIKKYNGAGIRASVHNPKVTALQSSGFKMKVQGGSDYIEVGWIVNPNLNSDNRTRLFIFTHTDNVHCFNLLCPGAYIQYSRDIPIGSIITPISVPGDWPYIYQFFIQRDPVQGNWWLLVGEPKVHIGFWPPEIFSGLRDLSTHIEWGGEVYSPLDIPSPQMGAGDTLKYTPIYDAYCEFVVTINAEFKIVNASNTEEYIDINTVYQVSDQGVHENNGHSFYYGGVGGHVG